MCIQFVAKYQTHKYTYNIMTLKSKYLLALFLGCLELVNGSAVEFLRDPKSRCPKYWVDATHVDMVSQFLQLFHSIYLVRTLLHFSVKSNLRDVYNSTLIKLCLGMTHKVSVTQKMPIW